MTQSTGRADPATTTKVATDELDITIAVGDQDGGSDHYRVWQHATHTDILLIDTNNLDQDCAASVVAHVEPLLAGLSAHHSDVDDILDAGRSRATEWLIDRIPAMHGRFVNSAILRFTGRTVEFSGAFAPAYIWEGGPVVRWTPAGTVWGAPHLLGMPAGRCGRFTLQVPAALVLASDGMLESRNDRGKINGDSLIIKYFDTQTDPMGHLDTVFDSYLREAHVQDDSFQLVTVGTRQPAGPVESVQSFVLFKADAYDTAVAGRVEEMLRQSALSVRRKFRVRFTEDAVFALWPAIYGRRWTSSLLRSMPGRDLDVWLVEGRDAVTKVINVKDLLRKRKSDVNSYRNLLHSPDSPSAFAREFAFLQQLEVTA